MAAISTAAEYAAVREAIQTLSTTGENIISFTVEGQTVTYAASQLQWLQDREKELLRRLSIRNVRKRTQPDFTS